MYSELRIIQVTESAPLFASFLAGQEVAETIALKPDTYTRLHHGPTVPALPRKSSAAVAAPRTRWQSAQVHPSWQGA